ncbi:MAG: hypothetical protein EZS28_040360 [Streblomastix strix]|uniref:AAA+ ATPase domain-containing protein n=1 Tax=Streblomastix strix TaxID=222440 RepID=A0A5J4U276_9EUKA|nr:MAG: hypothetical protein EZS28_040360 [Streblomastix strix]
MNQNGWLDIQIRRDLNCQKYLNLQPPYLLQDNSDDKEKQFERLRHQFAIDMKKREDLGLQDEPVYWKEIIGKKRLKDILKDDLLHNRKRKMHFFGPPGNGKKMMARALATEGGLLFLALSPEMIESDNPARNIRIAFEQANKLASSVLFIDRIDDLIGDGTSDRAKMIMNEIETQMNKVDTTMIVTSSLSDPLPEQFMQNFNVHAQFALPSMTEIDKMAQNTESFSYSDLIKTTETLYDVEKSEITVVNF